MALTLLRVSAPIDVALILPPVQRLFSTFPNAWPGLGLLLLRATLATSLADVVYSRGGIADLASLIFCCSMLVLASSILVGFATPLAAGTEAAVQIGIMALDRQFHFCAFVAASLGVSLAMLGPGAWSLDARLLGRKRLV